MTGRARVKVQGVEIDGLRLDSTDIDAIAKRVKDFMTTEIRVATNNVYGAKAVTNGKRKYAHRKSGVMTVKEAAKLLNVDKQKVYAAWRAGEVDSLRGCSPMLFLELDIRKWGYRYRTGFKKAA